MLFTEKKAKLLEFFGVLLLVLSPSLTFSQSNILGRVVDYDDNKPIAEASIIIKGTTIQTQTNSLGYFQLNVDPSKILIIYRAQYDTGFIKVPSTNGIIIK